MKRHLIEIRRKILMALIHDVGLPLLLNFRKPKPWYYTHEQLRILPEGSWGKALAELLDKNNYKLLANYEHHDAKHVLLGYPMDEVSEVRLQFFFFGNRRYTFPVLSTVFVGSLLMPEYWNVFLNEYKKGQKLPEINKFDLPNMMHLQLNDVRRMMRIVI
jgi:ubiquinone biosynthesis protein Coq4